MPLTPLSAKRELYADFGRDIARHPLTDDVVRKTNEDAVKESIRNIVLTNKGERPFQPNFGCDVRKLLFENYTPQTSTLIEQTIRSSIAAYEPRAEVTDIRISPTAKTIGQLVADEQILFSDGVRITIQFEVINVISPITLELILKQIR